jgi:hypothetical protein
MLQHVQWTGRDFNRIWCYFNGEKSYNVESFDIDQWLGIRKQSRINQMNEMWSQPSVPPQVYTHTGSSSIVLSNMHCVLFSYACILIGQGFICRYIFMAMYSSVPIFREATFCSVPSCVFDNLGCAAGEKRLRNTIMADGLSQLPANNTSN